jgi:hypothetical protein
MIAHADHAVMILTRTTLTPIVAARIAAVLPGTVIARAILAGTVVTRTLITCAVLTGTLLAGAVIPRTIFARALVAAAVVTTAILTAITAAFGPRRVGVLGLGRDGDFNHRQRSNRLQRCDFGVGLHRAITLVGVAVTAARAARFITRAVGPV